ncbi:MAG: GNAT family N-acetyltransferase [Planctomycetota bacterium]
MTLRLRAATAADRDAVAALIHASTNGWYLGQGRPPVFAGPVADCGLFFDVYEQLDPGRCLLAEEDGQLLGSCFWHPRPTHVSLGIMNVSPAAFGRGVARRLLSWICGEADRRGLPVRLVSSAQNLDSFSLYNRAGFAPIAVFQDVQVPVPTDGLGATAASRACVRDAVAADVPAMLELEREILGIDRASDLAMLVDGFGGVFSSRVCEDAGRIEGFLIASRARASAMLGPGCARSDAAAIALLSAELDARHRGAAPIVLAPSDRPQLLSWLQSLGGRNVELHLMQVRGEAPPIRGVVLPTFLPESS